MWCDDKMYSKIRLTASEEDIVDVYTYNRHLTFSISHCLTKMDFFPVFQALEQCETSIPDLVLVLLTDLEHIGQIAAKSSKCLAT